MVPATAGLQSAPGHVCLQGEVMQQCSQQTSLTRALQIGIINLTVISWLGGEMAAGKKDDPKVRALRETRSLNPRAEAVSDQAFAASEFLDARDLVQVKYEMVRRVRVEGEPVARRLMRSGSRASRSMPRRRRSMRAGCRRWCPSARGHDGRTSSPKRCSRSVRSACRPIPS